MNAIVILTDLKHDNAGVFATVYQTVVDYLGSRLVEKVDDNFPIIYTKPLEQTDKNYLWNNTSASCQIFFVEMDENEPDGALTLCQKE